MVALMTVPAVATAGGATAATTGLGPNLPVSMLTWGENVHGQLGNSSSTGPASPMLPAGTKVISAAGNCDHSLALTSTGKVLAWGSNV
jgi:alpha-tubulin suppressor-like RCC1 family protein